MLHSFFRAAVRSLRKRPGYTFLNGFSLSLGLACFLLIGLFVSDELRYDRHHEDADRIVRIGLSGYPPSGGGDHFAMTSPPVGRVIREEYPEAEAVARFNPNNTPSVTVGVETHSPESVWIAEPELFDVFTLPIVDGESEGLLEEPATAVLSRSTAEQFFGRESAVGRTIVLDDTLEVRVSAVMEDQPRTSHMDPQILVSWSTYYTQPSDLWLSVGIFTYARLAPGVTTDAFQDGILNLVNERNAEQMDAMGFRAELIVEPLTDIYLHSTRQAQLGPVGDMSQVWIFGAVAIFVLLLAVINFTNLATARSMERAREVGIRKAVGSSRASLVIRFLGESILLSMMAFVLSLALAAAALPVLNSMAGKELAVIDLLSPGNVSILFVVAIVAGVLGGAYPAIVMSGFRSITVLRGAFRSTGRGTILRKALVASQFAISIALIAGTVIVVRQVDYMQTRDLGFDKERMLIVNMQNVPGDRLAGQQETIKTTFEGVAGVESSSISGSVPGRGSGRILFGAEGVDEQDVRSADFLPVGHDYFDNYGIEVIAGRALSPDFPADVQESVVISEVMVEYLGWESPEAAIGKWISLGQGRRTVVGVVADYHHESLKQAIEPMMFVHFPQAIGYASLRLAAGDIRQTREAVEEKWTELYPAIPMDAFFLDADYDMQYESEIRLRSLFSIFAGLAIMIACLGLIGLAAFTAQQRTKEIGVRKVLGASVPGLVALLSREFAILVGVGFVLAVPAAAWGMDLWLDSFPYRAGIGVWPFILAGSAALLIALLSVSWQSIRAATADPVRSLRYE